VRDVDDAPAPALLQPTQLRAHRAGALVRVARVLVAGRRGEGHDRDEENEEQGGAHGGGERS
jgi:hypothetical protein